MQDARATLRFVAIGNAPLVLRNNRRKEKQPQRRRGHLAAPLIFSDNRGSLARDPRLTKKIAGCCDNLPPPHVVNPGFPSACQRSAHYGTTNLTGPSLVSSLKLDTSGRPLLANGKSTTLAAQAWPAKSKTRQRSLLSYGFTCTRAFLYL